MSGPDVTLPRRLGFLAGAAVVIGNVIGSGIFRVPSTVAAEAGSVAGVALVWVLGGAIALCGALTLAELATAFPRAGGVYVYLREAYGPLVAFLVRLAHAAHRARRCRGRRPGVRRTPGRPGPARRARAAPAGGGGGAGGPDGGGVSPGGGG